MASGLVFVNDVLIGNAIDDAGGFLENVGSGCFVAGFNGLTHAFDRRAKHGAQAGIVLVALNRLAGAFAGLGGIGHFGVYPCICVVYSAKTAILYHLLRRVKSRGRKPNSASTAK